MSVDCLCRWTWTFTCFQWNPDCSYPMSRIASRVRASMSSVAMASGPRTSPAMTTRFVVQSVSQATRAPASAPRYMSTTVSDIRSQTLSGWPSETDSLVNR